MNRIGSLMISQPAELVAARHAGPRSFAQVAGVGGVALAASCILAGLTARFDAPVVLVGIIAGAAVFVMLFQPVAATLLSVFLLYINFPAMLTKQHGVPEVFAGAFILILAFPLMQSLARGASLRADLTFGLILAFLGVSALASLQAIDQRIAMVRVQTLFLEGVVVYWLFLNVLNRIRTLRQAIWVALAAGSLVSALSLYQDLTGSYDQEFGGLAYRNYVAETPVDGEGVRRPRGPRWDRAQGPVNEPNRFAQILVVLVPFAVFMCRAAQSPHARVCAGSAFALILTGIVLTLSRGAFVTLAIVALGMMAFKWLRPSHLVVSAVALGAMLPLIAPSFLTRIQSLAAVGSVFGGGAAAYKQEADGAMLGRTTAMLSALYVFLDHPVLGVGPGQFSKFYVQEYSRNPDINFRDLNTARRAHNLYLEIAAETGIVGLAAFLAIAVLTLRRLWRTRLILLERSPDLADLLTACWLSLVAYLSTGMFLHLSYQLYYWMLLAFASAALYGVVSPEGRPLRFAAASGEALRLGRRLPR